MFVLSTADPVSDSAHGKTEVSLTLTNKFDIFSDSHDKPDSRGLLLRYVIFSFTCSANYILVLGHLP